MVPAGCPPAEQREGRGVVPEQPLDEFGDGDVLGTVGHGRSFRMEERLPAPNAEKAAPRAAFAKSVRAMNQRAAG
ncbi:hypothetical protein GCM10010518_56260 [Kitasatospora cinereorecta]